MPLNAFRHCRLVISAAFLVPTEIRSGLRHVVTLCHVVTRCHFSQVVQELFAHRRSGAKSMVSSNGSVQHLSFQWFNRFNHVEALQSDCLEAGGPMATHQGQPFQQQRTATMPCRSMPCTREEGGIRPTLHIDVHGCRDPLEPPEITPGHDANGCFWVCHGLSTFILMKSRALFSTFRRILSNIDVLKWSVYSVQVFVQV